MRNTALGYQARNMAAPRRRFGMGAASGTVSWSGFISPIPGSVADNSDYWTQYYINLIVAALSPYFSNISVVVDPVGGNGVQTVRVSATQVSGDYPQNIITNAVSGTGLNLDLGSVQFSAAPGAWTGVQPNIVSTDGGPVQFTDRTQPVFQPPQSILGNPGINGDGTVNLPLTIDYSAPNAPLAVVVLPTKGGGGSTMPTGSRGGTIPTRGTPLLLDGGSGDTGSDIPPVPVFSNPLQNYTPPPIPVIVHETTPDSLYNPTSGILPSDFTGRATDSPVVSGTKMDWAGFVSPFSGDYWQSVILGNIQTQLSQQYRVLSVSADPVGGNGVQTIHVSVIAQTSYNSAADMAAPITAIVSGQANLDHGSINYQLVLPSTSGDLGHDVIDGPVPVVVLTMPTVPLPTVPIPVVPLTNTNDPYYVPAATSGGGIGVGVPPSSPDPTSTVMPGTPLNTPTLPGPTTTVIAPTGLTTTATGGLFDSTIDIFGIKIPVILLVGVGGLLLLSGSSSKR